MSFCCNEPFVYGDSDRLLHFSQLNWLGFSRRVEINTMAAIFAVDHMSRHSLLMLWVTELSHAGPLPRIFFCISKHNIVSFQIDSTIELVSRNTLVFNDFTKNPVTVVRPVIDLEKL